MTQPNEPPPWEGAALEEYKAHRAAFLESQASAQRTLAFGATAVGVLIAGAFNVWKLRDPLPATLLFLVVIPIVSSLVIVQWAGQMLQLGQRNKYLLGLEGALRLAHPTGPPNLFTWEGGFAQRLRIRDKWWQPDLRWHMNAAMPVFGLLALGSLVMGVYKGFSAAPVLVGVTAGVEFAILSAVAAALAWELGTSAYRGSRDSTTEPRDGGARSREAPLR